VENFVMDEFHFPVTKGQAGEHPINVTFSLDASGLMDVFVLDHGSHGQKATMRKVQRKQHTGLSLASWKKESKELTRWFGTEINVDMPMPIPKDWNKELDKAKVALDNGNLHKALEMIGYAEILYKGVNDNGAGRRKIAAVKDDVNFKIKFGSCDVQPLQAYLRPIERGAQHISPSDFFKLYLELDHFKEHDSEDDVCNGKSMALWMRLVKAASGSCLQTVKQLQVQFHPDGLKRKIIAPESQCVADFLGEVFVNIEIVRKCVKQDTNVRDCSRDEL